MKKIVLSIISILLVTYSLQAANTSKFENKAIEGERRIITSEGITSTTHKKYLNKIVFALKEEDIAKQNENEAGFITSANLGEPIFYRVYLDKSLSEYLARKSNTIGLYTYKVKFYVDGIEVGEELIKDDLFTYDEKNTLTTFRGAIKNNDDIKFSVGEKEFNNFLKKQEAILTEGSHKIKIEYIPIISLTNGYEGNVVASGEITLNIIGPIFSLNYPKLCVPKSEMQDKELEEKIMKAFEKKGLDDKAQVVHITSSKWNMMRHENSGVITRRYVEAAIGTTNHGICKYYVYIFCQDYDGSGFQEDVYISGFGDDYEISCTCFVE